MALRTLPRVACLAAALCLSAFSQVPVQTFKADLSVPFGVAPGRLIIVSDHILFADDEKPDASFAVARAGLKDLSVATDILTLETAKPVRDRSGERTRFSFRLASAENGAKLTTWFKAGPAAAAEPAKPAAEGALQSYQVKHNHLIGSCNGRLIVEANRLVFESITDISHSRQWGLKDVKELGRDNPYALKVEPFSGDTYKLELQGRGMDSDEYRALVDRITAARIRQ